MVNNFGVLLIDVDIDVISDDGQSLSQWVHPPLGLMYLASTVKAHFPDVEFKIFHTVTKSDPYAEVKSLLNEFNPNLIGLRSLSICKHALGNMARFVKECKPDVPLVAGGPHPSSSPEDLVKEGVIDMVAVGEGEMTFLELIAKFLERGILPLDVPGTYCYSADKTVMITNPPRKLVDNLDLLHFPDYSLINMGDYAGFSSHSFQEVSNTAFICSSRGCSFNCFYCHNIFGKRVRHRSAENVVEEMKKHYHSRNIRNFVFVDDLFNVPMPVAKKTLTLIAQEMPDIHLNFPNGLRADLLDDELIDLFAKAGTVHMALAVETASPRLQKLIGKHLDLVKAKKNIEECTKRFVVCGFFMVGFPTETYEEAMETINFAKGLNFMVQPVLSILRLYKGTSLYDFLAPTKEQEEMINSQEVSNYQPKFFHEQPFYGDFFSDEKVPLKSKDIKKIRWGWMGYLGNRERMRNSHNVLQQHYSPKQIMAFYKNFFGDSNFNEETLASLLGLGPGGVDNIFTVNVKIATTTEVRA